MLNQWNLRVYLLIVSPDRQFILVAQEFIQGTMYIKFPGGGVEFGEGIVDAAHREAMEELGLTIALKDPI